MGTSDSIEANASSFLVEMRETSHLLKNLTSRSLVLVDELGRGTAHADGLAICRAVSERLLDLKVYTFFATHFFEICWGLAALNGFRSMHLEQIEDSKDGLQRTRFCVQHVASMKPPLLSGSWEALHEKAEEHYGLRAAEHLGLPQALQRLQRVNETMQKECTKTRVYTVSTCVEVLQLWVLETARHCCRDGGTDWGCCLGGCQTLVRRGEEMAVQVPCGVASKHLQSFARKLRENLLASRITSR
ncbi:MSH4 [Symbiodinium natans]|uniref:MSH4 protein n=1 Tax=Symbiodinium natans TaxID=878477 RepID=A0A812LYP6_9DINO|nr:MSH4 [Symbiodinium natans]CAE7252301.1 MSH4 [Symbiodinium natans]